MAACISPPVGCSSHLNLTDSSDCIEVRHWHNGLISLAILDSSRDSRNVYFTKLETSLYLAQLFFHARFKAEMIPPNLLGRRLCVSINLKRKPLCDKRSCFEHQKQPNRSK